MFRGIFEFRCKKFRYNQIDFIPNDSFKETHSGFRKFFIKISAQKPMCLNMLI